MGRSTISMAIFSSLKRLVIPGGYPGATFSSDALVNARSSYVAQTDTERCLGGVTVGCCQKDPKGNNVSLT